MNRVIYALIIRDEYDSPWYNFVKIDETEKQKLIQFCKDTQDIKVYNNYIKIVAWCYDIEIINSEDIEIIEGKDLTSNICFDLKLLDEMQESHYLHKYNIRDQFIELTKYNWIQYTILIVLFLKIINCIYVLEIKMVN